MRLIFPLLLIALVTPLQATTMYKWLDANGNVVYSQKKPPPGAKILNKTRTATKRKAESKPGPANPAEQKSSPSPAQENTRQQETVGLTPEQKQIYKELCEKFRKNLAMLLEPTRVFTTTAEGNKHFLSDDEREQQIREINKQIPRYCQDK